MQQHLEKWENLMPQLFVTSFSDMEPASAAGAVVPQFPKEDTQDEPGTMTHMQLALQKVEHEKLVTNARAWEESAKARIANRFS